MSIAAIHDARSGPQTVQHAEHFRSMCHDVRQPLAAILVLAAAAAAESEVSDTTRARLEQIAAQASWMSSIIRDALGDGAGDDDIDLRDTARESAGQPGRWNVACRMNLGARPVRLHANPTLVRRAMTNLVDNAYRAAGPGGTVRLAVRTTGPWAVVEVEDSGPGYGHIEPGSGLGLGVVTQVAAEHGGRVVIGRSSLGGARIRLALDTGR
jgi:signal transduction histidine kinase